jgi:uncharacterized protein (UPF0261 family)
MIGAFDSKGEEYDFVRSRLETAGLITLTMNWGVLGGTDRFPVDIDSDRVASAGGASLEELRRTGDQQVAVDVMAKGAAVLAAELYREEKFDGVFGIGKVRGTSVAAAAMRALPIGVPKVIVSTVAGNDTSAFIGAKDINIFPSIVDVSGLNAISETILAHAAGAVIGMVNTEYAPDREPKPIVAMSMFGQTRPCVERCKTALIESGYEVLVFHATGAGGRTMEAMVEEGHIAAVLDITTTEWADELFGGAFSAGPRRLEAPGRAGIPHVIVPGCIDMVNFGSLATVPVAYKDRWLYESKPTVTLMRTTADENREIGRVLARKASEARGPVAFLIPLKGLSRFDAEGGPFWCPEADRAAFQAIHEHVRPGIDVVEVRAHINDEVFARTAAETILAMMPERPPGAG